MRTLLRLFGLLALAVCTLSGADPAAEPAGKPKFTYVIVHGAWARGWSLQIMEGTHIVHVTLPKEIARRLEKALLPP